MIFRKREGVDLSKFLDGPVPVNVTITHYGDGKSSADLAIDLAQARLFSDLFDYEKKPGEKLVASHSTPYCTMGI